MICLFLTELQKLGEGRGLLRIWRFLQRQVKRRARFAWIRINRKPEELLGERPGVNGIAGKGLGQVRPVKIEDNLAIRRQRRARQLGAFGDKDRFNISLNDRNPAAPA